jgi:predicted nucleotidyltransferase
MRPRVTSIRRRSSGYNAAMPMKQPSPRHVQPYRYVSPDIPMSAIRRFARQVAEKFRPEKIILFGSYAYGTPHDESDVDLLVVMPTANEIDQAIRIKQAFERPFALDVVVKTPARLARELRDENWFLREAVAKGKVLYEAADDAVGSQGRRRSGVRARPRRPSTATP